MEGRFILDSQANISKLERKLKRKECFLNITFEPGGNEYHSITILSDGKYLFSKNTNLTHIYLLKGLGHIGTLRDSVLYSKIE